MNTLNKILLSVTCLLVSSVSIAQPLHSSGNYVSRVDHKTVSIDAVSSKQRAYMLGAKKLSEFEGMSGRELSTTLIPVTTNGSRRNSTHLKDGGYVTVQERLNSQGQLEYVAKIHINVHYQERDSNN
ncbi:DUF3316 domain-containing protein [Vibrio sp. D420a]|jgi:hypothetical protein|uniref:DUF3316 domain-containing protein n=1 Tax=Vibrio TaxID=662 RepID=UPI00126892E6|nr:MULTISPECIES: DUF3316 domain-containing protein [unclassified Vibrio]MDK9764597.1 DUF3316 domain-containing protein [Vibrio sp. D420a]QFT13340.1 hypothetical protein FIV04_25655 [Vibrio sp. THAF190c]